MLNINFRGTHVFKSLFSIKLSVKWDQAEVSKTILKISLIWPLKFWFSGLFYVHDYNSKTILLT